MTIATDFLAYFVGGLGIVSFLITLANLKFLRPLVPPTSTSTQGPLVSVLIPARNEEGRIDSCLESIVSQEYKQVEVLVLDDRSADRTAEIVESYASADERITLVRGEVTPDGWIGKHWACDQLFKRAQGDLILFMDADTILAPRVISAAVHRGLSEGTDLLTVMPRRRSACLTEQLISPFIDWVLFCWFPIYLAHKFKNSHLSATFGQFMLFRPSAYAAIGGHSYIRNNPIDDFELGRRTKAHGLKWTLYQGTTSVETSSYKDNADTIRGVARSVFPALNYRLSVLIAASTILLTLGFVPLILLITAVLTDNSCITQALAAGTSIILLSATWIIMCHKFRHGYWTVPLYPLSILVMVVIAYRSAITYALQTTKWKDRRVNGPRLRL